MIFAHGRRPRCAPSSDSNSVSWGPGAHASLTFAHVGGAEAQCAPSPDSNWVSWGPGGFAPEMCIFSTHLALYIYIRPERTQGRRQWQNPMILYGQNEARADSRPQAMAKPRPLWSKSNRSQLQAVGNGKILILLVKSSHGRTRSHGPWQKPLRRVGCGLILTIRAGALPLPTA